MNLEPVKLPEEEPVQRRGRPVSPFWQEIAAAAEANPGEWIPCGLQPASYVHEIHNGTLAAFRSGRFTARSYNNSKRGGSTSRGDLFVKYADPEEGYGEPIALRHGSTQ